MRTIPYLVAAGAVAAALASCDAPEPLAPGERAAAPRRPKTSVYTDSREIRLPGQNHPHNGAVNWDAVNGYLAWDTLQLGKDSVWVRLRVDGKVTVTPRSEYDAECAARSWTPCPAPAGGEYGPNGSVVEGQSLAALKVTVRIAGNGSYNVSFTADGSAVKGDGTCTW